MAGKFRQLQRRITSIRSTVKITRAMELVAASRIVKAQARLVQAEPYAQTIYEAAQELAGIGEVDLPLLKVRDEIRTVCILVITSDRGLAGSYNSNVIRVGERLFHDAKNAGRQTRLHIVGRKGIAHFKFRGHEMSTQTTGISDTPQFENARDLGEQLTKEFADGLVDEVWIAYTDFRSAGNQVATSMKILPLSPDEFKKEPGKPVALYEFEPDPASILSLLLPRYVNTIIYAALLESAASEHAARRRAMKAATENGQDLAKSYTRIANRERQAEITSEIMEVVGGAEALRDTKTA